MIERANKMAQSSIHTSLGAQLFANARNTEIILQARLAQLRLQTIEYRDSSSQTRSDLEANHRVLGFRKSVLSNVNPAERYTPIAVVTATLPSGPSCLYTRPKRNSRTGPNPKRNLAEGDGGEEGKNAEVEEEIERDAWIQNASIVYVRFFSFFFANSVCACINLRGEQIRERAGSAYRHDRKATICR